MIRLNLLACAATFGISCALPAAAAPPPLLLTHAQPVPTPVASASPGPQASAGPQVPAPSSSPVGPATASPAAPSPMPAPSPTKTPDYTFRYVPKATPPPEGEPQIIEVDLNSNVLRAQGDIDMRVLASPNVVKVISRSGGHSGPLTKVGDGEFVAAGKLPKLPFFVGGVSFNLQFVASTADGHSASVTIPVKLH